MRALVGHQVIHDLVRQGRIAPAQGAMLLELRAELAWKRKPWWERWLRFVARGIFT